MAKNAESAELDKKVAIIWSEPISTAEMARRLKITKNALLGRAHRLGLDAKPSPILRGQERRAPSAQPIPAGVRTIPLLPSER